MSYGPPTATRLYKYQWDAIQNPSLALFSWMEREEEGEEYSISELIKTIREANVKGLKLLYLFYNKCPEMALKNIKMGNKYLSYLHISCSEAFENQFYNENINKFFSNELYAKIDPSEINRTNSIGVKSKREYVRFNFHKLNIPENKIGKPTFSDSVLFYFAVPKEEADDFEEYLFAKNKSEIIIQKALEEMEVYLGLPYAYGGGASRTSMDSIGTAETDCSEFVARFIQKSCGMASVPNPFYTSLMTSSLLDGRFDSFL